MGRPSKRERAAQRYEQTRKRGIPRSDTVKYHAAVKAAIVKDKLMDAIVETNGNVTQAAKQAGVSVSYARKLMPEIREELMAEFERHQAGSEAVAKVVKEAMDANKVVISDGVASETDVPDHAMRLKAATFHTKITGGFAPTRSIQGHQNLPPEDQPTPEKVRERLARLRELEEALIDVTPQDGS